MEPIQLIVDYPDFGHPVATDVAEGKVDFGIISSGNGIAMTANKHRVRAVMLDERDSFFSASTQ
jgi:ribose 5-phosphate isomerase B